jgi:hypothetical protein
MPSFIYIANYENPEIGDLRQLRLFLDVIETEHTNIFSLFNVLTVKIILFIINSICFYIGYAIQLKDSQFMLTSINQILLFFVFAERLIMSVNSLHKDYRILCKMQR